MRDAVGGTFMIYVLLIFLAVYITFVAVAFNYARAFRVKNKVIDIIEQNEGMSESDLTTNISGATGQIIEYLNNTHYKVDLADVKTDKFCSQGQTCACREPGYCINKIGDSPEYYQVTTFVRLELPFIDLGFTIPIKGETRKIERIRT